MSTDGDALPTRPLPRVTTESAAYWAGGLEGQLLLGRCEDCARLHHPPHAVCPGCWSSSVNTVPAAGTGTVEAVSIVHRNGVPAFKARLPYAVVYVTLDEGPRVTASMVNCEPDLVTIGMRVQTTFERLADEVAVPLFEPAP